MWPWLAGAGGVAFVLWLPVAIQQLTGHPGNITAVMRYTRTAHKATQGVRQGMVQVLRVAGLPPWLGRNNLTGFDLTAKLSLAGGLSGAAVMLAMVVVALVGFRRRPEVARLGITALVVAVGGVMAGSNVPRSIEAGPASTSTGGVGRSRCAPPSCSGGWWDWRWIAGPTGLERGS